MRAAQAPLGVGLDPKIDTDPKIESVGFAQDMTYWCVLNVGNGWVAGGCWGLLGVAGGCWDDY